MPRITGHYPHQINKGLVFLFNLLAIHVFPHSCVKVLFPADSLPSINLRIYPSVQLSTYPTSQPANPSSNQPTIHPPVHPSTHLLIHPHFHPFIHQTTHEPFCAFTIPFRVPPPSLMKYSKTRKKTATFRSSPSWICIINSWKSIITPTNVTL